MKIIEIILGFLALIGFLLSLFSLPAGNIFAILSFMIVSIYYFGMSIFVFNDIGINDINNESFKKIPHMRIIGAGLVGLSLSMTTTGLLFKLLSWPGASMQLTLGVLGLIIGFIVGLVKYIQNKSKYYKRIFLRLAFYGIFGLTILFIPKEKWIEIKYKDYPSYIKAIKEARANPDNQELWDKVNEERQKMNQEE